jgi:hypothetical protein
LPARLLPSCLRGRGCLSWRMRCTGCRSALRLPLWPVTSRRFDCGSSRLHLLVNRQLLAPPNKRSSTETIHFCNASSITFSGRSPSSGSCANSCHWSDGESGAARRRICARRNASLASIIERAMFQMKRLTMSGQRILVLRRCLR